MTDTADPKIYLITPPEIDLQGEFSDRLRSVFEAFDIACLRLSLSSSDERVLGKTADLLREVCHAHEVAIVIERHMLLVEPFGLDGVHLADGAKNLAKARKLLGKDAIVGAYCAASRHAGMSAAEIGADYVSFGPVTVSNLDDGEIAKEDLFEWWSQMIEVPVIAEGRFDQQSAAAIAQHVDFLAFGDEIWSSADPIAELNTLMQAKHPS